MEKKTYLPRCVLKAELVSYFGCDPRYFWSEIISEELLHEWGFDPDKIKPKKRLDDELTYRIYIHKSITDLNQDYSTQIRREIEQNQASPAE